MFLVDMKTEPEPAEFPEGTTFADVDGVPVAMPPDGPCKAFDTERPRRFAWTDVAANGEPIEFEAFEELRKKRRSASL